MTGCGPSNAVAASLCYVSMKCSLPYRFQEDYRQDVGVRKLLHDRKEDILMHRWRFPSLSFHGQSLMMLFVALSGRCLCAVLQVSVVRHTLRVTRG